MLKLSFNCLTNILNVPKMLLLKTQVLKISVFSVAK